MCREQTIEGRAFMSVKKGGKLIAQNKKARHDYFVDDSYEAGIALCGTEVKSIRAGAVNLKDSYCTIKNGELYAVGMHISPYEKGNIFNHNPLRDKKLLMHKKEIMRLAGLVNQKGYTLVPLSLYFSGSRVKLEVGLCRGKKLYDKREAIAKKEAEREIERRMRNRSRDV
jgi:SsrA-binding protein